MVESIRLCKSLYHCETVVCYNGLQQIYVDNLMRNDIKTIDQSLYVDLLRYTPYDSAWKFYPPRLQKDSHEIFIDNDLVIYGKCPTIESFLTSRDSFILAEAHARYYGQFDPLITHTTKHINSCLFGVPPGYDLGGHLNRLFLAYPNKGWTTHFDDEGAIAFLSRKNSTIIPMEDLYTCTKGRPFVLGKYGCHFPGLNSGFSSHWNEYKLTIQSSL